MIHYVKFNLEFESRVISERQKAIDWGFNQTEKCFQPNSIEHQAELGIFGDTRDISSIEEIRELALSIVKASNTKFLQSLKNAKIGNSKEESFLLIDRERTYFCYKGPYMSQLEKIIAEKLGIDSCEQKTTTTSLIYANPKKTSDSSLTDEFDVNELAKAISTMGRTSVLSFKNDNDYSSESTQGAYSV